MPRGGICSGTAGRATHRSCSCAAAACQAPPAGPAVPPAGPAVPACWACSTRSTRPSRSAAALGQPSSCNFWAAASSFFSCWAAGSPPQPPPSRPPLGPRRGGPRASQPNLPDGLFQARMLVSERRRARDGRGLLVAHAAQLSKLLWRARGVRSRPPPPGGSSSLGQSGCSAARVSGDGTPRCRVAPGTSACTSGARGARAGRGRGARGGRRLEPLRREERGPPRPGGAASQCGGKSVCRHCVDKGC